MSKKLISSQIKNQFQPGKNTQTLWMYCNWAVVLVWITIIWLFSSQSVLPGPQVFLADFLFKKSAHIFMFALLYFWFWRAFSATFPTSKKFKLGNFTLPLWLVCFLLVFAFSFLDEVHQSFVPGRTATVRDIGFDLLGATIMYALVHGMI